MSSVITASTTSNTALTLSGDTSGQLEIKTGAGPTTAITISSAQAVTFANPLTSATLVNPTISTGFTAPNITGSTMIGFKNRIINGAMVIDQRNAGASVTPSTGTTYLLDRWAFNASQASKASIQQNAGSVTPPVGFINYFGLTSLSAYSVGASELFCVNQRIEGFNVADLNWGTANAKTITLSFWVRSSLTGTFGGAIENGAADRSYPFSYTISSANTWEQKSVTIAGDTTGTWLTDNSVGLNLRFSAGSGTSVSGTAGVWGSTRYFSVTGAVSVVGTSGATFYITGVQLEVGSTATSFDYRPYGTELALCQRYLPAFNNSGTGATFPYGAAYSTTRFNTTVVFPVPTRTAPTGISTSGTFIVSDGVTTFTATALAFGGGGTTTHGFFDATVASGLTQYRSYYLYTSGTAQVLFTGCEL